MRILCSYLLTFLVNIDNLLYFLFIQACEFLLVCADVRCIYPIGICFLAKNFHKRLDSEFYCIFNTQRFLVFFFQSLFYLCLELSNGCCLELEKYSCWICFKQLWALLVNSCYEQCNTKRPQAA